MTMTMTASQSSGDPNLLFQEPALGSIDSVLFVGTNSPAGQFGVVQWPVNPSGGSDVPVSWNVGDFTGFYPNAVSSSQRGVSSSYGSTAVQEENGTIGILIDSNSLKTSASGALLAVLPQYNFSAYNQPVPFAQANETLVYSLDVQIPTAKADNAKSFAYATMYFDFHDTASGLNFWYGAALFDSRGASMAHEMLNYDGATNQAIVAAVVGANGQFSVARAGSSGFQSTTWRGFKHFEFAVTETDMNNAIAAVKARFPQQYSALSTQASHYTITEINFNPEVATFGGTGEIGLSVKNIGLHLEATPIPPSAHQFLFNGSLGSTVTQVAAFVPGVDDVLLSHRIFTGLNAQGHVLASSLFHVGQTFTNATQRIDYNPANGWLTYDSTGSDPAGHPSHFMTLPAHLNLHNTDFLVVA